MDRQDEKEGNGADMANESRPIRVGLIGAYYRSVAATAR